MSETRPFSYAILQVVPCLQRGERLNVGVILYCRQLDYLGLRFGLPAAKLEAIAPDADLDQIQSRLQEIRQVILGEEAGGALARMDPSDRFGWLVAPSSTIIQSSTVHTGLTTDPAAELDRLFEDLVA